MNVDQFAAKALQAIAKNVAIIVIPGHWKIKWWLSRLSPSLSFYFGKKMFAEWRRTWETHHPKSQEK